MIKYSYQTDVASHFKASRQIFNNTVGARYFYAFFYSLPIILVVIASVTNSSFSEVYFGLIPMWLLILLLFAYPSVITPLFQYIQIRSAFKSNPTAQAAQTFEISNVGFKCYGEGFNVEVDWKSTPQIKTTKDYLLLYISKSCAYYVPRSLVTDSDYTQIMEWYKLTNNSSGTPQSGAP